MRNKIYKKIHNLNMRQIIALVFLSTIIIGALLLSLPFASTTGKSVGFFTALFTATSSVCVTGLSLVDIWSSYSLFGQIVQLFLMEIGGLGFMSVISILFHITKQKSNVQSLSLMAEAISYDGLQDIVRIQKRLIVGSLSFEAIGALILFISFVPTLGFGKAVWYGVFHSVSAFCNAGFDLMGYQSPGSSLITLQTNPLVLITISALIIIGGIGFIVWDDIAVSKAPRKWSVNTRLVLQATSLLLVIGTVSFLLLEYNNPATIGNMSLPNKIVNAFFQSTTTRTAGFAAIDQGNLTDSSLALTILFMMVGGSAGSTAGGIKTITLMILIKAVFTYVLGKKEVTLMHRRISQEQITQAFTVAGGFFILSIVGGFILNISSHIDFMSCYYESVSALATVGLSVGITSSLPMISKIVLILFMYIGRVGLLTITVGFFRGKDYNAVKYPPVKIMIG